MYAEHTLNGLPPIALNESDPEDYNKRFHNGYDLSRAINGKAVSYSYWLKQQRGLDNDLSDDRIIHSSSNCTGWSVVNDDMYQEGRITGTVPNITWPPSWDVYFNTSNEELYSGLQDAEGMRLHAFTWARNRSRYSDEDHNTYWVAPLTTATALEHSQARRDLDRGCLSTCKRARLLVSLKNPRILSPWVPTNLVLVACF